MASDQRSVCMSVRLATTGSVWSKGRESLDSGQGHGPCETLSQHHPCFLSASGVGQGLDFEGLFSGIASR